MGSRVQNSSDEKEEKYVEGILPPLGLKKAQKWKIKPSHTLAEKE